MCFPTLASLGVTTQDGAEVPEEVEITVTMDTDSMTKLVLRCLDPDQFSVLAAACIHAAAPSASDYAAELQAADKYASRVKAAPDNSFEDTVNELQGDSVRTYYAYYPNQYQDGNSWLQLTLIFARSGSSDTGVYVTPVPDPAATASDEYEGITTKDDYSHF